MTKESITKLLTKAAVIVTIIQGSLSAMPKSDEKTTVIISAILMFLVIALTAIKQYVSLKVADRALVPTLIVLVGAVGGLFNEIFAVVTFSDSTAQWIRFGVTVLALILNSESKELYPSRQYEIMKAEKKEESAL